MVRRVAIIDKGKCRPDKCNHECRNFCPVVRAGDPCIEIKEKAVIDEGLCIGCGICVSPETEISTETGLRQIKWLKEGDKVLTHTGKFKKITEVMKTKHTGKLFKVKMWGLPDSLLITENHPIFAISRKPIKAGKRLQKEIKEPQWIPPEGLKKGDYVTIPILKENNKKSNFLFNVLIGVPVPFNGGKMIQKDITIPCEPDFFRLIGYYLAEGSTDDRRLVFSFNENETNYINDIAELVYRYFGKVCKLKQNTGKGLNVVIDSAEVTRMFKQFGVGCDNKKMWNLLSYSKTLQKELIKGLWRVDGSRDKKTSYFTLGTTSRDLAYGSQNILARLGITSTITRQEPKGKRTAYYVHVCGGNSVDEMNKLMGTLFKDNRNRTAQRIMIDKNYIYLPIRKIEVEDVNNYEVMNLEVEDDHTYVAGGITVHNCIKKCPFDAIRIVNLPEQLKELPVHRYGINEFTLFRIPFPVEGKVTGIIGPNGCGKSTGIKILSGSLKPNFGQTTKYSWQEGEDPDMTDELIKKFKGTEIQNYLEKLKSGKVRAAIKPQHVIEIPKVFKGTVRELLEKADQRKVMHQIAKELSIENILDRNISHISGGELQRVAIAATICKDADIYYFDEPSSYLDVYQRLQMAKLIRTLTSKAPIIVIEHDMATLDYLSDQVHLLHGKPGVYGVVSKPYSARVGINVYLSGFIKEDNIRIRQNEIKFETRPPITDTTESPVLISWSGIEKKLEEFNLSVSSGEIKSKEVIGILGANSLGKTTFAKILAGEIKQDSGDLSGNVKISYKPQYISQDYDGTVRDLLSSVTNIFSDTYRSEILNPLEIDHLLEKKVKNLSGGELQRVAIALCLSRQADLYLLDEPSAYLDVEQRLAASHVIRRQMQQRQAAAIVIDHDIMFLDYIADRAMVFTGQPSIQGGATAPMEMREAMNEFLKSVGITFRRDPESGRPRANKPDSQLDREQRQENRWYYSN